MPPRPSSARMSYPGMTGNGAEPGWVRPANVCSPSDVGGSVTSSDGERGARVSVSGGRSFIAGSRLRFPVFQTGLFHKLLQQFRGVVRRCPADEEQPVGVPPKGAVFRGAAHAAAVAHL